VRREREVEDWVLGALLRHEALLEIRSLMVRPDQVEEERRSRAYFLANLCDNMPFLPGPSRDGQRRFAYAWQTVGPKGREWILRQVRLNGLTWTPPDDEPAPARGTWRSRLRVRRG
jgi:hypothetical protein